MSHSDYIARIQLGHQLSAALKRAEAAEARVMELEALIASQQPAGDGWIEWAGGECPLAETNCLEVKFRSGAVDSIPAVTADMYEWMHGGCFSDIIAYRVVKP